MIYENELQPWKVNTTLTESDEYVKFAFECNETTSHDNETTIEINISSI